MRVVFDLTPLATGSRFRGIGTYTMDLARALAAEVGDDVELLFLVGFDGKYDIWPATHSLELDEVVAACGGNQVTPYQRYYFQKRGAMKRFLKNRDHFQTRKDDHYSPRPDSHGYGVALSGHAHVVEHHVQ